MKNKRAIVIFIVAILVIGGGLFFFRHRQSDDDVNVDVSNIETTPEITKVMDESVDGFRMHPFPLTKDEKKYETLMEQFLKKKMLNDGTFITNYKVTKDQSKGELATGHDRLSESSGLWLRHLALTGQKKAFDDFYKETKKHFYRGGQFSYRLNADKTLSPVNATVDDLRIMRALIEAAAKFNDNQYIKELESLLPSFSKQSIQGNMMVDFYDIDKKRASSDISLYYLELQTMGYIYKKMGISQKYLEYEYNILKDGYISDAFPFYYAQYSYKDNQYVKKDTINVIESLLSILYLAEIGEQKQESIDYIKEAVTTGTLYNKYDLQGNPVDKSQSSASYAIVAMIAKEINDKDLYQQALQIIHNFQIITPQSPIFGVIGDPTTLEVFSYNNLMALLAYDY